jgi:phosphatidylglycerol:prolipoprotein diacylglycerol transferase
MHPILFKLVIPRSITWIDGPVPWYEGVPLLWIGGREITLGTFGVMVASGFLLGMWILGRIVQKYSADPEGDLVRYAGVHVWIMLGVIGGARLMYVAVEIAGGTRQGAIYLDQPLEILNVMGGGLVMFGGMFGAMALGAWRARKEGLHIPEALDFGMPAAFFGMILGRIGCLLVGDDYGKVVPEEYAHLPFPITLHIPEVLKEGSLFGPQNEGQVLWATQPWMSINGALLGLFGLWLLKRRRYRGQVAITLVFAYAVARFTIEAFRGDILRGMWFGGAISTSQLVAIATAVISLGLIVRGRGNRELLQQKES